MSGILIWAAMFAVVILLLPSFSCGLIVSIVVTFGHSVGPATWADVPFSVRISMLPGTVSNVLNPFQIGGLLGMASTAGSKKSVVAMVAVVAMGVDRPAGWRSRIHVFSCHVGPESPTAIWCLMSDDYRPTASWENLSSRATLSASYASSSTARLLGSADADSLCRFSRRSPHRSVLH